MVEQEWYWCLTHQRVEQRHECRAEQRLGPYSSPDEAQRWKERNEARSVRWEEEDERWAAWGEEDQEDA